MEELILNYKNKNVILFVGAGVSQNLGLPSWSALIDNIATELGFNPEVYKNLWRLFISSRVLYFKKRKYWKIEKLDG